MAYSRKKLDNADSLLTTLKYLHSLEQKALRYKNSPMFPGIKRWEDYDILGMTKTKEHIIRDRNKEDLKAFWRVRPDILRKTHAKKKTKKQV